MREPHYLEALGTMLAGNLAVATIGFFILFAAFEALFGTSHDPGSTARGRLVVNFSLPILTSLLALIVPFGVTTAAVVAEREQWGLFNQVAAPALLVLLAALLSRTGLGYLVHRLSHGVPLLWRLHKVHHADRHVDISLGLRHHPLEMIPGLAVYSAGTLLLGLPVWAAALVEALLIAVGYSDHLGIQLPPRTARVLRALFVTPDVHHIHHSAHRSQTDSNFGSLLIVWDRLFGTYRPPDTEVVRRYGLDDVEPEAANNLWAQLALPFGRMPSREAGVPLPEGEDSLREVGEPGR